MVLLYGSKMLFKTTQIIGFFFILSFLFVRVYWTLYQWIVISDLHVCLMELVYHF